MNEPRPLGGMDDPQLRGDGPCGLCGRNPSAGRASVATASADGSWQETWYCHDEPDPDATSCYEEASHLMVRREAFQRRARGELSSLGLVDVLLENEPYEPSPYDGTYSED